MASSPQPQPAVKTFNGEGSVIAASQRTRPLWFDGRFLAAKDLERDQNYFLQNQSILGRAAGFGVIHGLQVEIVAAGGQAPDAETIVIRAGQGLTPSGQLVMLTTDLTIRISDLAEEEALDVQFGLSRLPTPLARTRSGLYVIALRPVQFTANPITAYPVSIQGSKRTRDGDTVEATAVSLVPYPDPTSNFDATTRQAALARQIFVTATPGQLSDSLLPLAMISIQRGTIEWVDLWMARRESSLETSALRFGLADPATQQAFMLQYDAVLQQIVAPFTANNQPALFAATDHFQALPPAGRFPLGSILTSSFTQLFFPQQMNVTLSLIPQDELPAVIEDSLSLPPFDLTQPASAFADFSLFALVPVPRGAFAGLAANLPPIALAANVPQVPTVRRPADLLRFFPPTTVSASGGGSANSAAWQSAIGGQTYGYYVRRRTSPIYVNLNKEATFTTLAVATAGNGPGLQLTANVSPTAVSGMVVFNDGSTILGKALIAGGSAMFTVTSLPAGVHAFTAAYQGDANFASSISPATSRTTT